MAPQHHQGKRLDGTPFETLDFDHKKYFIRGGRATRHGLSKTEEERTAGVHFDQIWYDERLARGAFGNVTLGATGEKVRSFLSRWLFFQRTNRDDDTEDGEWGPIRPLGSGSYGIVGLWQKRNDKNQVIDEVVCKEQRLPESNYETHEYLVDKQSNRHLLIEAAIHRDINQQHPRVSPHLRGYKYLQDSGPGGGRYRFYFEYCPYGNLRHLIGLYHCWDTFLPEPFLWHVFHHLANACDALRDCPPPDTSALDYSKQLKQDYGDVREELYCLHCDMKPANFLLGYSHEGESYPSALLNDYGLSSYTSHTSQGPYDNPKDFFWRGTEWFKSPEQEGYGAGWTMNPDGGYARPQDRRGIANDSDQAKAQRMDENQTSSGDVHFDPAVNVYGIAATMIDLITLPGRDEVTLRDTCAFTEEQYRQNGNHIISEIDTKTPGIYSTPLRDLVRRCLDPDPSKRPTHLELNDQTRRGLRLSIKRARRSKKSSRVYFRGHEINKLPLGTAAFDADKSDFASFVDNQFLDPDAPRLRLPQSKYGGFDAALLNPAWRNLYNKTNRHERWFKPVGAPLVVSISSGDEDSSDSDGGNGGSSSQVVHPPTP